MFDFGCDFQWRRLRYELVPVFGRCLCVSSNEQTGPITIPLQSTKTAKYRINAIFYDPCYKICQTNEYHINYIIKNFQN